MTSNRNTVVIVAQRGEPLTDSTSYGTMRATIEVAKHLIRTGRSVLLVGAAKEQQGTIHGIPFLGVWTERELPRALRRLAPIDTLIGVSRCDVFCMVRAARRVVYQHNPLPITAEPRRGEVYKALNEAQIHVICPSEFCKSQQESYGLSPALAHVVPNGIDCAIFCGTPIEHQRKNQSLIYAGHIAAYKGIDILLQAFRLLKHRFSACTLTVCGAPPSWFSTDPCPLIPESWLDSNGGFAWGAIEDQLPGLTYRGEMTSPQLAAALRAHSMLVAPSRVAESFGLVSLEAQACGCVPLLPRRGAFPETMIEGETGYLYENNTPEELAAAIAELWNADRPTQRRRDAAEAWASRFSWERSGTEFIRLLDAIVLQQPAPKRLVEVPLWIRMTRRMRSIVGRCRRGLIDAVSTRFAPLRRASASQLPNKA